MSFIGQHFVELVVAAFALFGLVLAIVSVIDGLPTRHRQ